jgi:hypothetical protein
MLKIIALLTKIIVAFLVALLFSSCHYDIDFDGTEGNGNITTETRNIKENFKSIDVSAGIEVVVEQASDQFVSVEADSNLQSLIETKVVDGVLTIKPSDNYNSSKSPIVTVRMPIIEDLQASSASEIKSKNVLKGNNINIGSSSGSEINVAIEFENISLDASSGSTIVTSGKAIKLETVASSGSEIDAQDLLANTVNADVSSGAEIKTHPIVKLKADASSGGEVYYNTEPKSLEKNESSGGEVSSN